MGIDGILSFDTWLLTTPKISSDLRTMIMSQRIYENDPILQCIDLSYTNDHDAKVIASVLKYNTCVRQVNIVSNNTISTTGYIVLLESLQNNTSIEELVLSCTGIDYEKIQILSTLLLQPNKSSIHKLNLSYNRTMGIDACIQLLNSLVHNTIVTDVWLNYTMCPPTTDPVLSYRTIDTTKVQQFGYAVCNLLQYNTTLRALNLRGNHLGDTILTVLTPNLLACKTITHRLALQELYLDDNQIGNDGGIEIAKILQYNIPLKTISISKNNIDDTTAIAVAQSLQYNTTCHVLNLTENPITNDGYCSILHSLEYNTTLQELYIFGGRTKVVALPPTNTTRTIVGPRRQHTIPRLLQQVVQYNDVIHTIDYSEISQPLHQILQENQNQLRVAPKKGGRVRPIIYNWLFNNNIFIEKTG